MKTLRLIRMALFAVLMCVNFTACSSDDVVENQEPQKYTISLNCVGEILNVTQQPLSRAVSPNLYEFIIYEGSYPQLAKRHAIGSFSSVDNISVELYSNKQYTFEVFYRYSTEEATNQFEYSPEEPESSFAGFSIKKDEDYYYGFLREYTPTSNGTIEIDMKRMVFGLEVTTEDLAEDASLNVAIGTVNGVDWENYFDFELTSELTFDKICAFNSTDINERLDFYYGVYENGSPVDYFTEVYIKITLIRADGQDVKLGQYPIRIQRNKKTSVNIKVGDIDNVTLNGISIECENTEITSGNHYEIDGDEKTIS